MPDRIRIIKHELFRSKCGSFEVRFADSGESKFFHFDDVPNRRVRPDIFTREQALELAERLPEWNGTRRHEQEIHR